MQSTQRIARLTPLDVALTRIDALVRPVAGREVALAAAVGRILAGDVVVAARPRVALALRDGWAVNAVHTQDAGPYAPAPLPSAVLIEAGVALPAGADAVAEIDAVVLREGRAEVVAAITGGEGVLPAGADADGATAFGRDGRRLHAVAAAALAAAGISRVDVRAPRVLVIRMKPAGDPIVDAAAALVVRGIAAAGGLTLSDDLGDGLRLEDALRRQDADAVVAIGGTGSGRNDTSVATLARLGRVEAHGIALSPGETAAFGFVETRPVLLLPGRLDGALAAWLLLGERMLARLTGNREEPRFVTARLTRKVASNLGLAELIPVRLRAGEAEPLGSGYLPLHAIAQADGWILVAPDREGHPAGAAVMVGVWP
ncbi:MAG TPA: molybdopterin-binding protein [Xanthobacteraceae bacterium]|nr:molybdopterin-binding protein [Xanthobacteraceae bacterium]